MRSIAFLLLAGWLAAPPAAELTTRRTRLAEAAEGTPVLIRSEASPHDFRYLTGRTGQSEALLLLKDRAILFSSGPPENPSTEEVLPPGQLKEELSKLTTLHVSVNDGSDLLQEIPLGLRQNLENMITPLRMVKSPSEVDATRRATVLTLAAHRAAAKTCRPGATEADVRKEVVKAFEGEPPAFPPIIANGQNALVLHYREAKSDLSPDGLLLLDLGATFDGYASDVSRTLPVDGTFSEEQRTLYDAVLAAQKAAEEKLRPGVTWEELHEAAADVLKERGLDEVSFARNRNFRCRHFIGHSVGLAAHDPCRYNKPLKEGMIVTIEPGLYDNERKIGIRIEDIYLVTAEGFERLSADLPREADTVEKMMAGD